MRDHKKYDIVKQNVNQSLVGRGEPNLLKQKLGIFGRSWAIPLAGAVLVSCPFFAYAHHVWKTKDRSKEEEYLMSLKRKLEEKEPPITPEERLDRFKNMVLGKKIDQRGYVQFSEENQKMNKNAGKCTKIDINEKYKRVEMYKQGIFGYQVMEIQFDDIVKDKDGNLTFHENGEPVVKKVFEFLPSYYQVEQWIKKLF